MQRIGVTSKSIFYAIIVHVLAGVLLMLNIDWPAHVVSQPRPEPAPVQASVVSETEIQKQMEALQQKEQAEKQKQEEARKKLEELLNKKKEEEQRLAEIREKQEQEKQEMEELEEKQAKEREELAKLKEQEQAEAERKRQEAEAERKRQEEAERQRKAEEERQRKAEEERQRKAEEERRRKEEQRQKELAEKRERERQLQEQLERERLQRQVDSALAQYIPIIKQKVSRNWNQPASLRSDIEAHVTVRLSENGEVLSARIVKSSGNAVFDRSVENAVLKASPLPIPQERGVNEEFRNLKLIFKPEEMIS